MKCRWKPCTREATHHDPPLCEEHHKARAVCQRGPLSYNHQKRTTMTDYTSLYNEPPKVKRLHPNATLPTRAHEHDAGWDLHALEHDQLQPGETRKIRTGIAVGVPVGQVGDVRSRSGLAARNIIVANSPGTLDPGYTGEVKVLLANRTHKRFIINPGDRIAQLVFTYINTQPMVEVDELDATERGEGGFGSTGI